MIILKSEEQVDGIRKSCKIAAEILSELESLIKPGVTTSFLNHVAEKRIEEHGVVPAFKGYRGFPYSICASVNDQVVHGFPNNIPLEEGDILSIDFGVIKDGWFSDTAFTAPVGKVHPKVARLLSVTESALVKASELVCPYKRVGDISAYIENFVGSYGLSVIRNFVGHGIGKKLHEDPSIPNFGKAGSGMMLRTGMVIAIEPMVVDGNSSNKVLPNKWTVVTKDGSLSAHFEHTMVITDNGAEILTFRK